jgi:alpha-D-xyloside xylohydrolase
MKLLSYKTEENFLLLQTDAGKIQLEPVNPKIMRVIYTPGEAFSATPSLMMLPRGTVPVPPWSVDEDNQTLRLKTTYLQVVIQKATGAFTWLNEAGHLLVREPEHGGKTVETDGDHSVRLDLVFSPDEALYGLGQHEEGILNYRGHCQYLYQHNLKVAIPQIVSTRGYAILWDTAALSVFHDDVYGSYFWSECCEELDFYFIYGPEFDQIVAGFRALTGQMPLLPRWAYGYIQSKERYLNQAELIAVVEEYRARGLPMDAIVQDWQSWPGGWWGQKTLDPDRFPDPAGLVEKLHTLNARLMISVWPRFQNDGPNQVEMREQGFLLGDGMTYNAFDPAARALYWQQAYEGLFKYGIDAWWCDASEPFEPDWHGTVKPEPWRRAVINAEYAKTYLDPARINAYSLLHSQGMYEGQRSVCQEKRVVNLTRSYFPGQQRYGTITWSGDISATWEVFAKQIAEGLNFSVTGAGYWSTDIGAFFVAPREQWFWRGDYPDGILDPAYQELYVRWFQFGTFLPVFRSHGTDTPREIWQFVQPGNLAYDTLVKFARLRYRLLPYIYSLAGAETHHAQTMLRLLAFDFRHDPNVYDTADQYMFGPALLVCPVTRPGCGVVSQTRPVYLPAGTAWYDFWTGQRYEGGQTIDTDAPLDILPLYVRAGSLLPMGPHIQHSGEQLTAPWEIRVYPGADGSFAVYEDEGDGYRYEQGAYSWYTLSWQDALGRFTAGPCCGQPSRRELRLVRVRSNHGIGLEPTLRPDHVIDYCGETVSVEYTFREGGEGQLNGVEQEA